MSLSSERGLVCLLTRGCFFASQDQRDRFRARVLELEADCQGKAALLHDSNAQAAKLTADNVKLYEKIRFLQSRLSSGVEASTGGTLSQSVALGGSSGFGVRARGGAASVGTGYATGAVEDDFERPYNRIYAESLDPFVDFSRREKARRYANLSAAEKITLTSSRLVLANKFARTAVFVYVIVMHSLVFATLWHFGHVSHRGCVGDHAGHVFDGATLGASETPTLAKSRLIERLMPFRLRGGGGLAVPQEAGSDSVAKETVSRFAENGAEDSAAIAESPRKGTPEASVEPLDGVSASFVISQPTDSSATENAKVDSVMDSVRRDILGAEGASNVTVPS
jgi:hypothetical protein